MVLLVSYALAGISWRIWPQPPVQPLLLTSLTSSQPASSATAKDLEQVAALHLFGEGPVTGEMVEKAEVHDAPETRLSLTLKGIIATSTEGRGRALIAEGSAMELVYLVGDSLSGGALLHEVLADKVILKRGGRFETLTLPRDRATLSSTPALNSGTAPVKSGVRTNTASGGAVSQQLRTLRDSIANDPQQAFSLIQAQPVMEGGQVKGYRVSPGRERRLFHGAGLRAGDVVTSVNGIALSDPAQMAALFSQFRSANRFDLMVERGGRATSLTIDLGQ